MIALDVLAWALVAIFGVGMVMTLIRLIRLRCAKCGAFIGNGGWIPFGICKRCGTPW